MTEYIIYNINFPPQVGVNALDYCAGDGETDDRANILAAIAAANGDTVYFPTATYYIASALTVPDGTDLTGSGMTTAWLKGPVVFGSTSSFTDLKIGPDSSGIGPSVKNANGSDSTSFTRCHFRGGGATTPSGTNYWAPNILLGGGTNLSNLTFTDCEIERALGSGYQNTVSVYASGSGTHSLDTVTWDDCHFGVTNGSATGSSRMMVENWTSHNANNRWQNLTFHDCEFEVTQSWCLDFACYYDSGRGTGVEVSDCLFHGSHTGSGIGAAINLEWPDDVSITGNTFHRCEQAAILWASSYCRDTDFGAVITGNTFDWDTAEDSIPVGGVIIACSSSNNTITGNTFTSGSDMANLWGRGVGCLQTWGGDVSDPYTDCVCTGNTIQINIFYLNATCTPYSASGTASNTFNQSATNPPTGTYNAVVRT